MRFTSGVVRWEMFLCADVVRISVSVPVLLLWDFDIKFDQEMSLGRLYLVRDDVDIGRTQDVVLGYIFLLLNSTRKSRFDAYI